MTNQSRRKFLKTITYGSAISLAGLSSATFVFSNKTSNADSIHASNDISIMQQRSDGKEIITLINNSDKTVTLDSLNPVTLERVNGSLVVKVNTTPSDGKVAMLAGERFTFDAKDVSANIISESLPVQNLLADHLMISSDHVAFNQIVPVTMFNAQTA